MLLQVRGCGQQLTKIRSDRLQTQTHALAKFLQNIAEIVLHEIEYEQGVSAMFQERRCS